MYIAYHETDNKTDNKTDNDIDAACLNKPHQYTGWR